MRLSQSSATTTPPKVDAEKAIAWLNKHWKGNRLCPVCANNKWSVSDDIIEIRPFRGGSLVVGGSLYPFIAVTCATCGNTLLFSAKVAGLVEGQE